MGRWLLLFAGVSALLAIPFLVWGDADHFRPEGTRAWMESLGGWAAAATVALLVADLVLPVPATGVMSTAGALFGWASAFGLCFAGSVLAAATGYGLCRLFGESVARRISGPEERERIAAFFARYGPYAVIISRGFPLMPEATSCLAGLARMPFSRFLAAAALGSAPVALVYTGLGAMGAEWGSPELWTAVSLLAPVLLWLAVGRRLFARVESKGTAEPDRDMLR